MANAPNITRDTFTAARRYVGTTHNKGKPLSDWLLNSTNKESVWWEMSNAAASNGSGRVCLSNGFSLKPAALSTPSDNFNVSGGYAFVNGRLLQVEDSYFRYYHESSSPVNYIIKGALSTVTVVVANVRYSFTDAEKLLTSGYKLTGCQVYFPSSGASYEITSTSGQSITADGDFAGDGVNVGDDYVILPPKISAVSVILPGDPSDRTFYISMWLEDTGTTEDLNLVDPTSGLSLAHKTELRWCLRYDRDAPYSGGTIAFPGIVDPIDTEFTTLNVFTVELDNSIVTSSDITDIDKYINAGDLTYTDVKAAKSRLDTLESYDADSRLDSIESKIDAVEGFELLDTSIYSAYGTDVTYGSTSISFADVIQVHSHTLTGTRYGVLTPTIVSGGAAYTVGNILTLIGGSGNIVGSLEVLSVSGGVVNTVSVFTTGEYTAEFAGTFTVSGGSGAGATFTATYYILPKYVGNIYDADLANTSVDSSFFHLDIKSDGSESEGTIGGYISQNSINGDIALRDLAVLAIHADSSAKVTRAFNMGSIPKKQGLSWLVHDPTSTSWLLKVNPGQIEYNNMTYQAPVQLLVPDLMVTSIFLGGTIPKDSWVYIYVMFTGRALDEIKLDTVAPTWDSSHPNRDGFCIGMLYYNGIYTPNECYCTGDTIFFKVRDLTATGGYTLGSGTVTLLAQPAGCNTVTYNIEISCADANTAQDSLASFSLYSTGASTGLVTRRDLYVIGDSNVYCKLPGPGAVTMLATSPVTTSCSVYYSELTFEFGHMRDADTWED